MAEFCLKCFNEIEYVNYTEKDVEISAETDLCEGCGAITKVVVFVKDKEIPLYFKPAYEHGCKLIRLGKLKGKSKIIGYGVEEAKVENKIVRPLGKFSPYKERCTVVDENGYILGIYLDNFEQYEIFEKE